MIGIYSCQEVRKKNGVNLEKQHPANMVPIYAFDHSRTDPFHAIPLQRSRGLLQFKTLKIQCRASRNHAIGLSPMKQLLGGLKH